MRTARWLAMLVATAWFATASWAADSYPSHAIKLVVGFPPGSSTDTFARIIAEKLSLKFGQPVVVDNHAGAGGSIAVSYEVKAAPDGYTLLLSGTGPLLIAPVLYGNKIEYDATRDLVPVALGATGPYALVARKDRFASFDDLVAKAKARPNTLSFSTSGPGTTSHLLTVLFEERAGVQMVHVPYKGSGQSLNDVVGGSVDLSIDAVAGVLPYLTGGQLKAYAVSTPKRLPSMPDVPTFQELGVKGYEGGAWIGFLLPLRTPDAITRKLSEAIVAIVDDPVLGKQLATLGMDKTPLSSADFARFLATEKTKWTGLAKQSGVVVE